MVSIRLIKPEDIPTLKYRKLDWDVEVGGVPYQVIEVDGFAHSAGGKLDYGNGNCYWAYPLSDGEPTKDNLLEYYGHRGACWGIVYDEIEHIRHKWDEGEIESGRKLIITRNGKPFIDCCCEFTVHEAMALVFDGKLDEHPLHLNKRNFDTECIGRKIWYYSQPAYISNFFTDDARILIEPDGKDYFDTLPEHKGDDLWDDTMSSVCTSIFDPHIWWWRDE